MAYPAAIAPDKAVQLGPEQYFVIGDNSEHSADSRYYGPVKAANIDGLVAWIYWPLGRMRIVR